MSFSIKQIKSILSDHGMPVESLDKAAEEICERHAAGLDSIKEERDTFKKTAELYEAAKAELDSLKANPDETKEKYEKLKKEYEDYKTSVTKEKEMEAKKAAYTDVCKDAGLNEKGIAKALKYAEWDSIELDESGKVKDPKAHIKSLKEEWAEHIVTKSAQGASTPNPPANGGGNAKTKDEILAIKDDHERQIAIAQNHELFGF